MIEGNRAVSDARPADQDAVGPLLKRLADQGRRLAAQEAQLAKAELAGKVRLAGVGAGLLGAAGLFGAFALITLTASLILALATVLAAWLSALIVTALYLAIAATLGLVGRARLANAMPLAPTQAIRTVKEDIAWLQTQAKRARR